MKDLKYSYKEYEPCYKYILVDGYMSTYWEMEFMTLDEILECIDDRFVFNEEANNEWSYAKRIF